MAYFEERFYKSVSALSTETEEVTPGNNERVSFIDLGGDGIFSASVKVEIIWDAGGGSEKILLSTHGSTVQNSNWELIGDGVKTICVKLTNDSLSAETIGGFYRCERYP